jgi:hypothetical protein
LLFEGLEISAIGGKFGMDESVGVGLVVQDKVKGDKEIGLPSSGKADQQQRRIG